MFLFASAYKDNVTPSSSPNEPARTNLKFSGNRPGHHFHPSKANWTQYSIPLAFRKRSRRRVQPGFGRCCKNPIAYACSGYNCKGLQIVNGQRGGSITTSKPNAQTHLFTSDVVTRSSAQHLQNVQVLWQGKIPPSSFQPLREP